MDDEPPLERWYGIRCLFDWGKSREPGRENNSVYEERIIVVEANTFEEAIQCAESEAAEYANDNGVKYMEYALGYFMGTDRIANQTEVFSLLRESELEPEAYIDRFFDTGHERQGDYL